MGIFNPPKAEAAPPPPAPATLANAREAGVGLQSRARSRFAAERGSATAGAAPTAGKTLLGQ